LFGQDVLEDAGDPLVPGCVADGCFQEAEHELLTRATKVRSRVWSAAQPEDDHAVGGRDGTAVIRVGDLDRRMEMDHGTQ